jgi:hypothetical protein
MRFYQWIMRHGFWGALATYMMKLLTADVGIRYNSHQMYLVGQPTG